MSKMQIQCGDFWISPEDLKQKEPLRSVMINILNAQSGNCGNKKAFLELVEFTAKEIISDLTPPLER